MTAMLFNRGAGALLTILFGALALGCGESEPPLPELAPVTGTVTLDGKPLSDATIVFMPVAPDGSTPGGLTNEAGVYELKTASGSQNGVGAPAGEYKVMINRYVDSKGAVVKATPDQGPMGLGGMESLPQKYSNPGMTTLTATVPKEGGKVDFELTSR